jgi:hypothetical protein
MSIIAQGSRSQVAFVQETVWGTTPATPTLIALPYTDFNINMTRTDYKDASIRPDRMERYSLAGTHSVTGTIAGNLSHSNFDPLFESACNSSFATNILKTGTTQKSFSFEQGQLDISQYSLYTGIVVDKLAIAVPVNNTVTVTATVIGKDITQSASTVATTLTPATANQPYTHLGGIIKEGGLTTAIITAIQLDISNNSVANQVLGSAAATSVSYGMSTVSGTATAYFTDAVLFNKFINHTSSSIEFTLTDGTNTLDIVLPNIVYTAAAKQIKDQGSVTLSFSFNGLYDATTGSNIVITRNS